MIPAYTLACMQLKRIPLSPNEPDLQKARDIRLQQASHVCELIDRAKKGGKPMGSWQQTSCDQVKVIVFPELSIGTWPDEEAPLAEFAKRGCIRIPGEETDMVAKKAKEYGVYVAVNTFEIDDDWPGRLFVTSFLAGPEGEILLRYRKICSELATNPGDILEEYVKKYGVDGLFPVVDTPYGKLACIICCDNAYPETWRCFMMNGAEVMLHSTGDPPGEHLPWMEGWKCAKRTRAFENEYYVASANMAGGLKGGTVVMNYYGDVITSFDDDREGMIRAPIDIEALRRYRRPYHGFNAPLRLRTAIYAPFYQREFYPANAFLTRPLETAKDTTDILVEVYQDLVKRGTIEPPAEDSPTDREPVPA